jgi:hypothetical protein
MPKSRLQQDRPFYKGCKAHQKGIVAHNSRKENTMRNQKQRKRMTALLMAFLLTFLAGAAFAFSPGQLTIGGTVNLDPNYVVWNTAVTSVTSPAAIAVNPAQNQIVQTVVVEDARDRTDQHISWEISFRTPGIARLDVTALNEHETLPAAVTLSVSTPGEVTSTVLTSATYGLIVGGNFNQSLPETIAPGAVGLNRYITVEWDGTIPPGFNQDADNPVFEFIIAFDYTAAP